MDAKTTGNGFSDEARKRIYNVLRDCYIKGRLYAQDADVDKKTKRVPVQPKPTRIG